MSEQKSISDLPEGFLCKVFKLLAHTDLKAVMMVCKEWKLQGETPTLWTWAFVVLYFKEDLEKLSMKRFELVDTIYLNGGDWLVGCPWTTEDLKEIFEAMLLNSWLTKVCGIQCTNLSSLDPYLVASVLMNLSRLNLGGQWLSSPQLKIIFTGIAMEDSRVKVLKVDWPFLLDLSPDLFASALSNVEDVYLRNSADQQHIIALLDRIARGPVQLKKLTVRSILYDINLDMDLTILGTAVRNMKSFRMYGVRLNRGQVDAILRKIVEGAGTLKILDVELDRGHVGRLDENLLNKAADKMGAVVEIKETFKFDLLSFKQY